MINQSPAQPYESYDALYCCMPKRQYLSLKREIDAVLADVLDSGLYFFGQYSAEFAEKFAESCNAQHCVLVANGTDALELALRALNLSEGSECLTVANAGGYTSAACHLVNIRPKYIDIESECHLINLSHLERRMTPEVSVLVITHLYGNTVDVKRVKEYLSRLGRLDVAIVEDCAQAHGGRYPSGEPLGSLADVATYSFYPTKNLGALGDAGAIVTNRTDIFSRVKALHQYGWTTRYTCDHVGGRNSRIDDLQAAVLSVKLPHLEKWNARRRSIIDYYARMLPPEIQLVTQAHHHCVGHLAVCLHPFRERILAELERSGIYGAIHYPILDFQQRAWGAGAEDDYSMEVSISTRKEIFTLPCFPEITSAELVRTVDAVRRALL